MAALTDDILYGLRNLAVGDDEETRIEDYELRGEAKVLLSEGSYADAYRAQIEAWLMLEIIEWSFKFTIWTGVLAWAEDITDSLSLAEDMYRELQEIL